MSGTDKPRAALLDQLTPGPAAAAGSCQQLRTVADTFAGVPDGRHIAYTLRLLAHFLDPS